MLNRQLSLFGIWISFLFVYVEWGKESAFFFEMEYDIIVNSNSTLDILMVPVVLVPFIGQIIILISVFKTLKKKLTLAGLVFCSIPVTLVFIGGVSSLNNKMIFSILPYIFFSYLYLKAVKKIRII